MDSTRFGSIAKALCAALAGLVCAGCATPPPGGNPATAMPPAQAQAANAPVVRGTASYLERIALPPGAVFEARVEDVTLADAPAATLGRTRVESPRVPVAFSIALDAAAIQPRRRYIVRAEISANGQLLFTTDTAYPVLTNGAGREVELVLRRVASAAPPPQTRPDAPLVNTYWKLVVLRGRMVEVADGQREPHLVLRIEPRLISGSGGCNRLAGGYALDGERLSVKPMATTRMACASGMPQEQAFLDALAGVARWRVEGQRLMLLDERGEVLAQFESRYLQ